VDNFRKLLRLAGQVEFFEKNENFDFNQSDYYNLPFGAEVGGAEVANM